jgi:hypothetical protein
MATPVNYTEIVHSIDERLSRIERMVTAIYNDEDPPSKSSSIPRKMNDNSRPREEMSAEEEVKTFGQQIPYNLLDDPIEVAKFQQFLYECKTKYRLKLYEKELEMVDYADKGFEDVRLSNRHLVTMKKIYQKVTGSSWPFHTKSGYMYKLDPYQPVWAWVDEQGNLVDG